MTDFFEPVAGSARPDGSARRLVSLTGGGLAEIVTLPRLKPVQVPANTPIDATDYADVEFQFAAGSVSVTRSLDGAMPYVPWSVTNSVGATSASASSPGIWATDGVAWLKFSAAVTLRAGA